MRIGRLFHVIYFLYYFKNKINTKIDFIHYVKEDSFVCTMNSNVSITASGTGIYKIYSFTPTSLTPFTIGFNCILKYTTFGQLTKTLSWTKVIFPRKKPILKLNADNIMQVNKNADFSTKVFFFFFLKIILY